MLHCRFAIGTQVSSCKTNQFKLENMKSEPNNTHIPYVELEAFIISLITLPTLSRSLLNLEVQVHIYIRPPQVDIPATDRACEHSHSLRANFPANKMRYCGAFQCIRQSVSSAIGQQIKYHLPQYLVLPHPLPRTSRLGICVPCYWQCSFAR